MALMDSLEQNDEPLSEYDFDGLAWVSLVSQHEQEGSVRVIISNLMPRTFDFVPYNWEEIGGENQSRY